MRVESDLEEVGNSETEKYKTVTLQVRMSKGSKRKLDFFAKAQGRTASEIIRKYIDRLPNREEVEK